MVAPGTTEADPLDAAANALKTGDVKEARRISARHHLRRILTTRQPGSWSTRPQIMTMSVFTA